MTSTPSKATAGPWIFEPHNGFGGNDPDGNPWPFGYISEAPGKPIFELHVSFRLCEASDLARYARLIAALPEFLAALEKIAVTTKGYPNGSREGQIAIAAISRATGEA